jgi:hypothetical protein
MARALGVICDKAGFQCTCVAGPDSTVEAEEELSVPASMSGRGEQLNWLLDEAVATLRRLQPDVVYMKASGGGQHQSSPDRHGVEAIFQVAAFKANMECRTRTTEQIRAAHTAKAKGAYEGLLERQDVKARSNKSRRERYLYALTALAELS